MSIATEMVVLEQVVSGDPAQSCALKVQQLPLDQQAAAYSTCVLLSQPSQHTDVSNDGAGVALAATLIVALIALVIFGVSR